MSRAQENFRSMILSGVRLNTLFILLLTGGGISSALLDTVSIQEVETVDTLLNNPVLNINEIDSIGSEESERYLHLTDADFQIVAEELNVEVAAIKAVVEIEAGKAMKGFWAPGIPVINFDRTMYLKYRSKATNKEGAKGESVPEGLSGYALKEWRELIEARKINAEGANLGTFWGMFQIGGFNYKICGCETVDEFVKRMAFSELEQLQLFAMFISNTGMVESLRKKDWRTFARKYNGPSYAKRGYHVKMSNAYKKYSI